MKRSNWVALSALTVLLFPLLSNAAVAILPDLVATDLSVNADCQIVVSLRNNGPGAVPDAGFSLSPPGSSGIQMYNDGQPFGGIVLGGADPQKHLQPAGGTLTYNWFSNLKLAPGTHTVKVDVDNNNSIKEGNETNNSLTKQLTCRAPLPDLQPTDISLTPDCHLIVTVRNNGPGTVPDSAFSYSPPGSSGVQMYNDGAPFGGIVLGGLDPSKQLKPVGGTVTHTWFPGAPNLKLAPGEHTVRVDVDNNHVVSESNESNNSFTKRLICGGRGVFPHPAIPPINRKLEK